jgi:hypothetical protein
MAIGTSGGPPVSAARRANAITRPTSAIERGVTAIFTTSARRADISAYSVSRSGGIPSRSW